MRYLRLSSLGIIAYVWILGGPAAGALDPTGIWLDHTKRGAVEIYRCGSNLCGRIVWMKNPLDRHGKPVRDGRNPRKSRRSRPICGMQMLGKLRQETRRTWDGGGWIYDPERGKSFNVQITIRSPSRLVVTGYLLSPVFGKSFNWTKAPEDISRCAPIVEAASRS